MSKVKNVWVFADGTEECQYLCSAAQALAETVTLVYIGQASDAVGAHKAYVCTHSAVNAAPCVAAMVKDARPELVLTATSRNGRLCAGLVAAAVGATVLTDLSELCADDGITGKRMVYGGAGIKVEKASTGTAVACIGQGLFPLLDLEPAETEDLVIADKIKVVGTEDKAVKKTNLAAAKRVVGAGRGCIGCLDEISKLAEIIGSEMGCTRPIAEEEKLMPREVYIGVSGLMLKPDVYIGAGISGQVQHMVGINSARNIFAINKDKNAPIFSQCDFGLVGDLATVVPALIEELK